MDSSKRIWPRAATTLALVGLFSNGLFGGAGCWFSRGKEGFVCKKNRDCKKGLYCRTFSRRGKSRKQCRPLGKRTISSKSGYTVFAIYLTYVLWIGLPIFIGILVVRARLRKKDGGGGPAAGGG